MLSRIFVTNLIALVINGLQKYIVSFNAPLYAYSVRPDVSNRTCLRFSDNTFPCHLWKWSKKNRGPESAYGDFQCAKFKKVMALTWKISPEMQKLTSSLNASSCAYLMRQTLHTRSHPRYWANKCLHGISSTTFTWYFCVGIANISKCDQRTGSNSRHYTYMIHCISLSVRCQRLPGNVSTPS